MKRAIKQVIKARCQTEGGGFQIRRPLPVPGVGYIAPILMIDEMGPVDYLPGEAIGACIDTHTPIVYQHWILQPAADIDQPLVENCNALLYVFAGGLVSNGEHLADGERGVLGKGDSNNLSVPAASTETTQLLLLGGVPLGESVVQHGPFVMNSQQEIDQAQQDYQQGLMGTIRHG